MNNLPKPPDFLEKDKATNVEPKKSKKSVLNDLVEDSGKIIMATQVEKPHTYEEYEEKFNGQKNHQNDRHHSIDDIVIIEEDVPITPVRVKKTKLKISFSNILTLLVVLVLLGLCYKFKEEADTANTRSSTIDSKLSGLTKQITALSMENEKLTTKLNQTKPIPLEEIRGSESSMLDTQKKNFDEERRNLEKRIQELEDEAQKREELIIKMRQNIQRDTTNNDRRGTRQISTNNEDIKEAINNRNKIESKNLGKYDEYSDPVDD